ncbi:MAG: hypothetical protein ACYCU8_11885, partial [Ferrimicrobium acidiphilum]
MTQVGDILWRPTDEGLSSPLGQFFAAEGPRLGVTSRSYDDLYRASITQLGPFWRSVARFCGFTGELGDRDLIGRLPDSVFFPDGSLNYAEEAYARFRDPAELLLADESGALEHVDASEFWRAVAQLGVSLKA